MVVDWSNPFIRGKKNRGATLANLLGTGLGGDLLGPWKSIRKSLLRTRIDNKDKVVVDMISDITILL